MAIEDILRHEAERCEGPEQVVLSTAADTIEKLRKQLSQANSRLKLLDALEECGVDNWEGYSEAQSLLGEDEEDED